MSGDLVDRYRRAAQEAEQDAKLVADAIRATIDRFRAKGFSEQSLDDGVLTIYQETPYGGDDEELWMGRSRLFAQATLFRRKLLKGTLPKLDELAGLLKQLREHLPPGDANQSARRGMNARDRDLSRLLSAIAAEAGARLVEIRKTNGGHVKARFDRGEILFISSTPGDYRDHQNTKSQAKRVLRG
jgi:hypothetical protein